jgi:hypothetical protein
MGQPYTVRVYPVVSFEALPPDSLFSFANKVQEFARFEVQETLSVSSNKYGEYSHKEVLQQLHALETETATKTAGVPGAVGITSVQLDSSASLIADLRNNVALVTDFDWAEDISGHQSEYGWLFVILQVAAAFIIGNICSSPDCVCNTDVQFSPWIIFGAGICEDCRKKVVKHSGVESLKLLGEAFQRVRGLIASGYSVEYLKELEAEQLLSICSQACELRIDEHWIREWLARESKSTEPITGQFPLLASFACEWSFAQGVRPEWADSVLKIVENVRHVDTLLYLTKKRHRDHSRHQLYVASIGLFLLNAKISPTESLGDSLLRVLNEKYDCGKNGATWEGNELKQCWVVTALLHDSGYPLSHMLEIVSTMCHKEAAATSVDFDLIRSVLHESKFVADRWVNYVSRIKKQIGCTGELTDSEVSKSLRRGLSSSFRHCFRSIRANGYRKSLPAGISTSLRKAAWKNELIFDHGLWSSTNLIELLRAQKWSFQEAECKPANLALIEAIEAIALHNVSAKDYQVGFQQNPMACLLKFCDQIQEWNRGTLTSKGFFPETDHIILSPVTKIAGDTYIDRAMKVRFELTQAEKLVESGWDLHKFIEPKQSLNIPDFPLNVSFEVSLPFRKGKIP